MLDDASGAEQVRPLLPAGPGSMLLVTSRQRLTGLDVDRRVSLAPLDMDDAVGLLSRIVGGSGSPHEDGAIRRLAGLCDQLPLALRIAGARLQNRSAVGCAPWWTGWRTTSGGSVNSASRTAAWRPRSSSPTTNCRSPHSVRSGPWDCRPPWGSTRWRWPRCSTGRGRRPSTS
ncbi:hypothetical protein O1L55_38465 [Streptomyces albulus]|nr:hypothetical protein [Streptomyces noursei]